MPHLAVVAAQWAATAAFNAAMALGASGSTAILIAKTAYFVTEAAIIATTSAAITAATAPKLPPAEAVMVPLNQTRPPYRYGCGRLRISGPRALWQSLPGANVESQMLHEGRVDGFEQLYLHDQKVSKDSNNFVIGVGDAYGDNRISIYLRPGRSTEIATPDLVALCGDDWTADHRNDGIAALDMIVRSVKDQYVSMRFPNGDPLASVVTRLSPAYDWRDPDQFLLDPSTWKWTMNAVLNHLTWEWYGRYLEKAALDNVTPNATQQAVWAEEFEPALEYWTIAAEVCDEIVTLKSGATTTRYGVSLMILSTDPADTVRAAFLKSYDGWMIRRSDGAWTVRAGKYVTPTFEVTDANLVELNWERGTEDSRMVNILEGSFLSSDNDYTTQAIDPWQIEEAISAEGEIRDTFDLPQVPDHGQARRLLKREMYRRRANRSGSLSLDLSGLDIGDEAHRWIRVVRQNGPMSMRNVVVEIGGEGVVDFAKMTVTFPIRTSGADIDEWTPLLEEGFKPNDTDRTPPEGILPPAVLDGYAVFQSDRSAMIVLKIEDPDDDTRIYQVSYVDSSGKAFDGPWGEADVVTGGLELRAGPVGLGEFYAIVRADIAGRVTEWSNPPLLIHVNTVDAPYFPPTYEDGTDINVLKPAEPGADVTGEHTSADTNHVSGVPAAQVITELETSALAALQTALAQQNLQGWMQGVAFNPDGGDLQTAAINAKNVAANAITILNLIGAMTLDRSAFAFHLDQVIIGAQTMAQYVNGVQSTMNGHTSSIVEQATAINGILAEWFISANNDTGAISGIKLSATGTVGHMDFVSGVIRFVTTSTSGDPKVPFIISDGKVVCTVDFEVDGAFLALGTVNTPAITDGAVTDFISGAFGSVTDLSTEKTVASLSINPQNGRVHILFRLSVENASTTEIALRVKVYRNGSHIGEILGTKLNSSFTTNYMDFIDDLSGGTSTVTYDLKAQTVTGVDIGADGGTGINRNLQGCRMNIKVEKK